jgi:hypothetical protein
VVTATWFRRRGYGDVVTATWLRRHGYGDVVTATWLRRCGYGDVVTATWLRNHHHRHSSPFETIASAIITIGTHHLITIGTHHHRHSSPSETSHTRERKCESVDSHSCTFTEFLQSLFFAGCSAGARAIPTHNSDHAMISSMPGTTCATVTMLLIMSVPRGAPACSEAILSTSEAPPVYLDGARVGGIGVGVTV